jgi:hypothetical protein
VQGGWATEGKKGAGRTALEWARRGGLREATVCELRKAEGKPRDRKKGTGRTGRSARGGREAAFLLATSLALVRSLMLKGHA